jgi:hypothetical protein
MSKTAVMPLNDYISACDKIREKTGDTELIKSGELAEKIEAVYQKGTESGAESGDSVFWDLFQNYGNRTFYRDAFIEWGGEYLHPKYKVIPTQTGGTLRVFYNCENLKKIESQYFDFSQAPKTTASAEGFYYAFAQCSSLEEIEDVGIINQRYLTRTFSGCDNLKKIARIYVAEDTTFNNTFQSCGSLEEVTFDGVIGTNGLSFSGSPLLTDATLRNTVGCLKDFREFIVEKKSIIPLKNYDVFETLTSGTLVSGEQYTITYTDVSICGTITDIYTVATVDVPTLGSFWGIKMVLPHIAGEGYTHNVYIFQDGENIMLYTPETYADETNPISISIVKAPTETRSITFCTDSVAKLETLTEGGQTLKKIANDKGWTVIEV